MALAKQFLISLFVVFLHFAGQIRYLTAPTNRYDLMWDGHRAAALLVALVGVAVVALLVARVLMLLARRARHPLGQRLLGHAFLLAVVSGVAAALPVPASWVGTALGKMVWLVGVALIGWSLARPGSALVRRACSLCLVFSPAPLIMMLQVLFWPSWHAPAQAAATSQAETAGKTPVFIFLFDEWSRPRSMPDGEFRPAFPHLRQLCTQAVRCRQSLSPADRTLLSVPRLLFQGGGKVVNRRGKLFWKDGDAELPTTEAPSLFSQAKQHGYRTYAVSAFHPLRRMLGKQVDSCIDYPYYAYGETLLAEAVHAVRRNVQFWRDPISPRVDLSLRHIAFAKYQRIVQLRAREHIGRVLDTCPPNTLAFFHVTPPHHPYIWNPDGTHRSDYSEHFDSPIGYERNLRCTDSLVGQFVARLRAAGRFDDALVILTSDHSWRFDPEHEFKEHAPWMHYVPLIIKLPGQRRPIVFDAPIATNQLKPLVDAVLAGERDVQRLVQILHRVADGRPAPTPWAD